MNFGKYIMKKLVLVIFVLLVLYGLIFLFADFFDDSSSSGAKDLPGTFAIYYTCDTRGHIEPCGCTSGMEGGISRRSFFLGRNVPSDYLLVDAGDVSAGPRAWELLELEYILKGYELMGYHAVNVGHREVSIGFKNLKKLGENYPRFVSANVAGPDGELVFPPFRIVELSNGSRCGIIGVVDDDLTADQIGKGLSVTAPVDAIGKYLPDVKADSDFVVLLAFTGPEEMKAIADQFFEIDVIIGGKVPQASGEHVLQNKSVIVYNTGKGKRVGRLIVQTTPDDGRKFSNEFFILAEAMKRDEKIVDLIAQFKQELKERDFRVHKDDEEGLSSITASRSKNANRYVGPGKCKLCHAEEYEIWSKSGHAHAFDSLEKKDDHYNPRCIKCHSVGYMSSDGYINARLTPKLKNVSCESCHGRGDYHAKLEAGEKIGVKKVFMKKVNCTECHDEDNSPDFDREKFWEKIAHGKE
ncbi:MAG: hypothetical protein FVQ82_14230 [Planctomycetes bacterium]|nr:hypothetical protein [Planctomycetota bacterium]